MDKLVHSGTHVPVFVFGIVVNTLRRPGVRFSNDDITTSPPPPLFGRFSKLYFSITKSYACANE